MAQFKPGETVKLKSGGPLMTVVSVEDGGESVWCEWFDQKGNRQAASFLMTSLRADDGGPVIA